MAHFTRNFKQFRPLKKWMQQREKVDKKLRSLRQRKGDTKHTKNTTLGENEKAEWVFHISAPTIPTLTSRVTYSTAHLIRNWKAGPGWISYSKNGVRSTRTSV